MKNTVAFVTKYNASVDMLSVSGELFIIIFTRACGNIIEPSPNLGLNEDILNLVSLGVQFTPNHCKF